MKDNSKNSKPAKKIVKNKYTLEQLRTNAGLTRKQLTEKIFISEQTLYNYEKFKSEPNINSAKIIAQFFNVDVEEIKW